MNRPKVEFFADEAGEHRFRVVGGNGEILVTSEGYAGGEDNARRGYGDLLHALRRMGREGRPQRVRPE